MGGSAPRCSACAAAGFDAASLPAARQHPKARFRRRPDLRSGADASGVSGQSRGGLDSCTSPDQRSRTPALLRRSVSAGGGGRGRIDQSDATTPANVAGAFRNCCGATPSCFEPVGAPCVFVSAPTARGGAWSAVQVKRVLEQGGRLRQRAAKRLITAKLKSWGASLMLRITRCAILLLSGSLVRLSLPMSRPWAHRA